MQTKVIKEVLMCNPLYYSISYTINPWMIPGSENKNIAQLQWEKLVQTYLKLGIKVNIIDQTMGLPDMVFATDQGIVFKNKFVVSNKDKVQRLGYEAIEIDLNEFTKAGGGAHCLTGVLKETIK